MRKSRTKLNASNAKVLLINMLAGKNRWHFGGGLAEELRESDNRMQEVYEESSKGFGWDIHKIFQHIENIGTIEKTKINNCCYFKLVV